MGAALPPRGNLDPSKLLLPTRGPHRAGAEVQRNRFARRDQTATNEDALLAHLLEQAEAMRAVVEGATAPEPSPTP